MMKSRMLSFAIIVLFLMGMMLSFSHAETTATSTESKPADTVAAPVAAAATPVVSASPPATAAASAPATPAEPASTSATAAAPAATPAATTAAAPAATSGAPAAAPQNLVTKATEAIPEGKKLVARVVWVKGGFGATMPGGTEKRPLKMASNVYMNDTLITDSKSEAQIIFTDNSTMTFRPDTKLYINNYNYEPKSKDQPEKKSSGKYILDLVTGGFRTLTGMVAKENPNDYAVNTPVATIGVRGTEYSLVYKQGQDLYIKRYEGEPCMSNSASGGGGSGSGKSGDVQIGGGAGGGSEVCLDQVKQYGYVANANASPVAIVEQPSVFKTDVEIIPVKFSGNTPGGGAGAAQAAATTPDTGSAPANNTPGGAGSSSGFCIQ